MSKSEKHAQDTLASFDFEDKKKELEEMMKQFQDFCTLYRIPFFISANIKCVDGIPEYISRSRTAYPMGYTEKGDKIIKMEQVLRGYDVIMPEAIPEVDMGDNDLPMI